MRTPVWPFTVPPPVRSALIMFCLAMCVVLLVSAVVLVLWGLNCLVEVIPAWASAIVIAASFFGGGIVISRVSRIIGLDDL